MGSSRVRKKCHIGNSVIWLKLTYILSKYNLYNVSLFVDLILLCGCILSFSFFKNLCNNCHSLIRFLNIWLLYRMDVLHKINTLVREWIKDVSRQKVNFVLWLKILIFSVLLQRDYACIQKWKTFGICLMTML